MIYVKIIYETVCAYFEDENPYVTLTITASPMFCEPETFHVYIHVCIKLNCYTTENYLMYCMTFVFKT